MATALRRPRISAAAAGSPGALVVVGNTLGQLEGPQQGGGDIIAVDCITRDGWRLSDCTLAVFRKLKKRGFIRSEEGRPYRVTRDGLFAVRAQVDNR